LSDKYRKFALSGIGISIIAGFILAVLGPYQTGQFPLYFRLIYWTGLCFVGALGASIFLPLANKFGKSPNVIATAFGQSFTATLAVFVCLVALDYFRSDAINIPRLLILFGLIWIISIVIASIAHLAENAGQSAQKPEKRPAIFERLKPELRQGEIHALMAEDHYVRVITSKGEDLILMRLSDAVKELGAIKGLPVHRSWWIAEAGVKSVKKSDGKINIELHGGQTAPVSRSNSKAVKEAGWV